MTKSFIKICNFVHYFLKEGGYPDYDQFSLLFFSLFMRGGREGVKGNSAKFIISTVFFLMASLIYTLGMVNYLPKSINFSWILLYDNTASILLFLGLQIQTILFNQRNYKMLLQELVLILQIPSAD